MIEAVYETPSSFLASFECQNDGALDLFRRWIKPTIVSLIEALKTRCEIPVSQDSLVDRAVAAAVAFVRCNRRQPFASWRELRNAVLVHVAKAMYPAQVAKPSGTGQAAIPEAFGHFRLESIFTPMVAPWSGDWIGSETDETGRLWLCIADVTHHGLVAHLIAAGLQDLWSFCWRSDFSKESPYDLMLAMHRELCECLPDEVFVECTLARLLHEGNVTVGSGGSRLLHRRVDGRLDQHRLVGNWLGLVEPDQGDQYEFQLADREELLLSTDGLFDQLSRDGIERVRSRCTAAPLFQSVNLELGEILSTSTQVDDIAAVVITRAS